MKNTNTDPYKGSEMQIAMAFGEVARSDGEMKFNLPPSTENDMFRGWCYGNGRKDSPFPFWYAGIMLLDPDTNESLYTISLVPNPIGGVDVIKTTTRSRLIRKLDVVKKVEKKGFNFGFFSIEKLKAKAIYADWRKHISQMKSTQVTRLDAAGKEASLSTEVPTLPEAEFEAERVDISSIPVENFAIDELNTSDVFYCEDFVEVYDKQGNLDDIILYEEPVEVRQNARGRSTSEPPGFYIKTGGQAGIPSFNMMEMYLINKEGERIVVSRNLCSKSTYSFYKKKVRIRKSSGTFSSKIKIKTVIKGYTETLSGCGGFEFKPEKWDDKEVVEIKMK